MVSTAKRAMLLVICLMVLSCGQSLSEENSKQTDNITLSLGMNMGKGTVMYAAAEKLAELVKQRSAGKLRIDIHPSQSLGSDQQMTEMAIKGELDLVLTPTAKLSYLIPAMGFFDIPFAVPTREDIYELIDGSFGSMLMDKMTPFGLKGVTIWENGFKQFTANSPMLTPDDFHGLTFRIMKNPVIYDQFRMLGAQAVPIDFFKTLDALRDGAVDGQENPLVAIYHMDFYKYQKHMTLSNHAYLGYVFYISQNTFDKLTPSQQEMLTTSIKELTQWQRAETARMEADYLSQIRESGVQISEISDEAKWLFADKLKEIKNKYWTKIGSDLMSEAENYLNEKYGKPEDDSYVIGLTAPLSGYMKTSGKAVLTGLQMAVNNINSSGGIMGRNVRIMQLDNEGACSKNSENFDKLSKQKNIIGIFTGRRTDCISNMLRTTQNQEVPVLNTISGAVDIYRQNDTVFSISPRDDQAAKLIAERAVNSSRWIGLLSVDAPNSGFMTAETTLALKRLNVTPIETHVFAKGTDHFEVLLEKFDKSGIDTLIFIGAAEELATLINSMEATSHNMRVIAHWSITGTSGFRDAERAARGQNIEYIDTKYAKELNTGTFANEYSKCTLCSWDISDSSMLPATIHAYDLTGMLAKAVENTATSKTKSLIQAMKSVQSYRGLTEKYSKPFAGKIQNPIDINHDYLFIKLGQ